MINIILCGGNGTRLWPISRSLMPKQFAKLFNDKSLFQLTLERNSKICNRQFIVSNAEQYFLATDQLEELQSSSSTAPTLGKLSYLLEPVGRNTAPAIALACMSLNKEETLLITPSDHLVTNESEYHKVINRASKLAAQGYIITFGIKPTFAETGFGYIETDGEDVKAFHEKPDFDTATSYLRAGNYYWNSGIFCFKTGVFLDELKKHNPKIFKACQQAYNNAHKDEIIRIRHDDMLNIPSDSIDYAVMEKTSKVKVVTSDIGWSDVGSFDALHDKLEQDINANTKNDNLIAIDSTNNLVIGNTRTIATIDINDLIIVDSKDALLISKKGCSQKVKEVVKTLRQANSQLPDIHLNVHRPWGTYTILEDTTGYKIKRIEVKQGKRISLQKHFHRNEHWIVVSGTATVTIGDKITIVRPNESIYIKMGETHRLENQGKIPVILIEAQVGEYTGEDDIVRIKDDFKRI